MKKFIDVEKLISSKNPKLLKRLPGFIIRYVKKILHQEEVNQILHENKDLLNADFCKEIVDRFNLKLNTQGLENIPKTGGITIACNHPLGGMDAIALVDQLADHRPDLKFIVNDLLLSLENLKGLFAGVNKHGSTALSSLQQVDELFQSDQAVVVFPAGLVSRKIDGKVQDLKWKKTFVSRARKYNRPIIPVNIDGQLSSFFYRLHKLRSFLGIKANIEMFYLVNELFKQVGEEIDITIGKAILPEDLEDDRSDWEWAEFIRSKCYQLKENR